MISNDVFVPIAAINYSAFPPVKGTKIVHQVPEGSTGSSGFEPNLDVLFDIDTFKYYLISRPPLCNKSLSLKMNEFSVSGFPVNIEGSHYSGNSFSFSFNFGFVFVFVMPYKSNKTPHELAVRHMGDMFCAPSFEEHSLLYGMSDKEHAFFSNHDDAQLASKRLTYYSSLLFSTMLPPKVNLKAFQDPISTVELNSLIDIVCDPTMVKTPIHQWAQLR